MFTVYIMSMHEYVLLVFQAVKSHVTKMRHCQSPANTPWKGFLF